jgi:hypothetical protein
MSSPLYNLLSRKAQRILNVLTMGTALVLFWFYCLSQGPTIWVSELIADSEGRYYVSLAFLLSFLPFVIVEWAIVYVIDRRLSKGEDDGEISTANPGQP